MKIRKETIEYSNKILDNISKNEEILNKKFIIYVQNKGQEKLYVLFNEDNNEYKLVNDKSIIIPISCIHSIYITNELLGKYDIIGRESI